MWKWIHFLGAYQKWHEIFDDKGVQIIQANLKLLDHVQNNVDKLVSIVDQDFGLMGEVHT